MSTHTKKRTAVKVPMPTAASLEEIGRFLEDNSDTMIEQSRTAALTMLVGQFIEEHRGDFSKKIPLDEEDQPHFVYKGGRQVDTDSGDWSGGNSDDGGDTEDNLSFSMKDGPSGDS